MQPAKDTMSLPQIEAQAAEMAREAVRRGLTAGLRAALAEFPEILAAMAAGPANVPAAPLPRVKLNGATNGQTLTKQPGRRRSGAVMDALGERVVEAVGREPGRGAIGLASELHLTARDLRDVLVRLVAAKRLKGDGTKRGMVYYPAG